MGTSRRGMAIPAVAVGITLGVSAAWTMAVPPDRAPNAGPPAAAPGGAAEPTRQNVGTGSCAARACHGTTEAPGAGPVAPIYPYSYAIWASSDPHHRAFDVLTGARSQVIVASLAKPDPKGWPNPPEREPRCLACHETPAQALVPKGPNQQAPAVFPAVQALFRDGVGCESCHGPAQDWLVAHTTVNWPTLRPKDRTDLGMVEMWNLADRVQVCVGCHVGAPPDPVRGLPQRDVNHDLIAAGHPRLAFEFAAFLDRIPPHWDELKRTPPTDFRARAWAIGQVATARASAALLAWRAGNKTGPWPELSEYSCFDCHFQLQDKLRKLPPRSRAELGRPAWGSWTMAGLERLEHDLANGAVWKPVLDKLSETMVFPAADREKAIGLAGELCKALPTVPEPKGPFANALLAKLKKHPREGRWDEVAKLYLAMRALNHPSPPNRALQPPTWARDDLPDNAPSDPALDPVLQGLYKGLLFPDNFDSPGAPR